MRTVGWMLMLVFFGCQTEDHSELPFEAMTEGDMRPPCASAYWHFLDPIHRGARVEVRWEHDLALRLAVRPGPMADVPRNGTDEPLMEFGTLGTHTVFVQTQGDHCAPTLVRRVVEVVEAYPGAPGQPGSDAIAMDDPRFVAWASGWSDPVVFGPNVAEAWKTPEHALGPATGQVNNVVSLGDGGHLDLEFEGHIFDGDGPDFAVFSNGFQDGFLELATVSVSSDGQRFAIMPHAYLGQMPVSAFGTHDPELMVGFAGKYKVSFGSPFDLAQLRGHPLETSGELDLHGITTVRISDVMGDGRRLDSLGHPIYDPTPTQDSAGFDLEALGVLNGAE